MWGLIKLIPRSEREFYLTRSILCTHCNNVSKRYGNIFRFFTTNQTGFLTLLTASQSTSRLRFTKYGCNIIDKGQQTPSVLDYSGAVAIQLGLAKLLDQYYEGNQKNISLVLKLLNRQDRESKKILKQYNFPKQIFEEQTRRQHILEKNFNLALEEAVEPTEAIVGELFKNTAIITGKDENADTLYKIGQDIGSLIYILDSVKDFKEDLLRGTFNAFTGCHIAYPNLKIDNIQRIRKTSWDYISTRIENIKENCKKLELHRYKDLTIRTLTEDLELRAIRSFSSIDYKENQNPKTGYYSLIKSNLYLLNMLPFIIKQEPDYFCVECDECAQDCGFCQLNPETLCMETIGDTINDPVINSLQGIATATASTVTAIVIYNVLKRIRLTPPHKTRDLEWPDEEDEAELVRELETPEDNHVTPSDRPIEVQLNELILDFPEEPVEGVQIAAGEESIFTRIIDSLTAHKNGDAKRPESWDTDEVKRHPLRKCIEKQDGSEFIKEQIRLTRRELDYEELHEAAENIQTSFGTASKLDDALSDPIRFKETGEGSVQDKLRRVLTEDKMFKGYIAFKIFKALLKIRDLSELTGEAYDYHYPDPLQWMELTETFKDDPAGHQATKDFVENYGRLPDPDNLQEIEIWANYYKHHK